MKRGRHEERSLNPQSLVISIAVGYINIASAPFEMPNKECANQVAVGNGGRDGGSRKY